MSVDVHVPAHLDVVERWGLLLADVDGILGGPAAAAPPAWGSGDARPAGDWSRDDWSGGAADGATSTGLPAAGAPATAVGTTASSSTDMVLLGAEPERASLGMVMRSVARRKDLRRFLVVIGAVTGEEETVPSADSMPTDQAVARLMRLGPEALQRLMSRAGKIHSPERVQRFAEEIGGMAGEFEPTDPAEVHVWLGKVGTVLRTTS